MEAVGILKNAGTENESMEVHGVFSYVGVDGNQYTVTYVADENGYRPSPPQLTRLNLVNA